MSQQIKKIQVVSICREHNRGCQWPFYCRVAAMAGKAGFIYLTQNLWRILFYWQIYGDEMKVWHNVVYFVADEEVSYNI